MLFRSALLSAAFWAVFLAGVRVAAVPPEDCGETSAASIEKAARAAVAWIQDNQLEDGSYVYEYNRATGTMTPEYNAVRHAGVTMSLYQAAGHFQDQAMLAAADRGLDWMLRRTVDRHGWSALAPGGQSADLGASDLMLVGLAERRVDTGDTRYDDLMRRLARFIVSLQRDDGGYYIAYNLVAGAPQFQGTSKYYPGESLLGLAMMQNAFPGEGWDVYARKTLDFIATRRDEVEDVDFPPLADQWAGYGLGEVAAWTPGLTEQEADYARSLAARFGLLARTEAERQGSWYGLAVRGRHARGAGAGTWIEGLAGIWRASQHDQRLGEISGAILERSVCISGIMAANQATREDATAYTDPQRVAGAWFRHDVTRMDDQQHTLSGLIYTLDAMNGDADRSPPARLRDPSP